MYYPKSKIIENLYTSGNEFIYKSTGVNYTGFYFSTFDNKYFTGRTYSGKSQELQKLVIPGQSQTTTNPGFFIPKPTDNDFEQSFIIRYFIKRVNGGADTIKEVSETDYNKAKSNVLYIAITLPWKISGDLFDTVKDNVTINGIIDTNLRTIKQKEKELPGITAYLKDLSQFSKNIL